MRSIYLRAIDKWWALRRWAMEFPEPFMKEANHWGGFLGALAIVAILILILTPVLIK